MNQYPGARPFRPYVVMFQRGGRRSGRCQGLIPRPVRCIYDVTHGDKGPLWLAQTQHTRLREGSQPGSGEREQRCRCLHDHLARLHMDMP
jgi:hypothetical protein